MRRRAFNIALVLSLVLEVLTIAAWVRSTQVMDSILIESHFTALTLADGAALPHVQPSVREFDIRGGRFRTLWAGPVWGHGISASHLWRPSCDSHIAWSLPNPTADQAWQPIEPHLLISHFQFAGFLWQTGDGPGYEYAPIKSLSVPFWVLAVVFGLLPLVWLQRTIRQLAHYREGLCPSCGYDLRATPGRCPECGYIMRSVAAR
jgi:hypothetical protein